MAQFTGSSCPADLFRHDRHRDSYGRRSRVERRPFEGPPSHREGDEPLSHLRKDMKLLAPGVLEKAVEEFRLKRETLRDFSELMFPRAEEPRKVRTTPCYEYRFEGVSVVDLYLPLTGGHQAHKNCLFGSSFIFRVTSAGDWDGTLRHVHHVLRYSSHLLRAIM